MGARFRSWWQQIKTHPVATVLIAIVIALFVLVILGGYLYRWDWTGFNGISKSGKTLWDWMQLLFIPIVLAVAGFWFNHRERKAAELHAENEQKVAAQRAENERKAAELSAEIEREITTDNQREAALQAYINEMSELLLHENLRKSMPEDEVRKIARVRTFTVLPRLDSDRKRSVLQFLHESSLIDKDKPIVDLNEADFSEANLTLINLSHTSLRGARLGRASFFAADIRGIDLAGAFLDHVSFGDAYLIGANLSKADLSFTQLDDADLSEANLSDAWLFRTNLERANLEKANLERASLIETRLNKAILRKSNLTETWFGQVVNPETGNLSIATDLTESDLSEADLTKANFNGANLTNAKVSSEQLTQAKSLQGATMPDGSIHE